MSMLYSDSNTKAADQKDGPLELVEDDKERELEIAQEAFEEVIASLYKNDEIFKPKNKMDTDVTNIEDPNNDISPLEQKNCSNDDHGVAKEETQLPESEEMIRAKQKIKDLAEKEDMDSDNRILDNDMNILINATSRSSDEKIAAGRKTDQCSNEKQQYPSNIFGEDTSKRIKEDEDSEHNKNYSKEKTENDIKSKTKSDAMKDKSIEENKRSFEALIDSVHSTLNGISNIEELVEAKAAIQLSLNTILSEYNSLKSQVNMSKAGPAPLVGIPTAPLPPMILPPPPPPPPPPPILIASKKIGSDGMPNENFSSMLQKAKVKITPGEDSESGVDEIEVRIKNKGKNNLKADIMSQLRNALNNRKKRTSLKDKYEDLH